MRQIPKTKPKAKAKSRTPLWQPEDTRSVQQKLVACIINDVTGNGHYQKTQNLVFKNIYEIVELYAPSLNDKDLYLAARYYRCPDNMRHREFRHLFKLPLKRWSEVYEGTVEYVGYQLCRAGILRKVEK